MIKNCSVFGHSTIETTSKLENRLYLIFEDLIKKGYETFYFGGFGMFDELCHKIISELREKYRQIKRIFCLSDPRHLRLNKRPKYLKNEDYEDFVYLELEFDWWYKRIYYRNCAIIDKSDIVVFYVEKKENSGAYKTFKYAQKMKKSFINILEQ